MAADRELTGEDSILFSHLHEVSKRYGQIKDGEEAVHHHTMTGTAPLGARVSIFANGDAVGARSTLCCFRYSSFLSPALFSTCVYGDFRGHLVLYEDAVSCHRLDSVNTSNDLLKIKKTLSSTLFLNIRIITSSIMPRIFHLFLLYSAQVLNINAMVLWHANSYRVLERKEHKCKDQDQGLVSSVPCL